MMERTFIILLPVFFTSNIISDEYENHREGLIFVTSTPIYKQSIIKFVYGFLLSQCCIFIAYISAYAVHLETSFTHWFIMVIYSLFLSLLGLTVSNLTRQSLLGFGITLMYWIVMVTMGFSMNQSLWFLSVVLNTNLNTQVVWGNVWSLCILSYVLIIFNICLVGRGEKIRKPLLMVNAILLIATVGAIYSYQYFLHKGAGTTADIIAAAQEQNTTQDTIVIIDGNNEVVEQELRQRGIQYSTLQDVQSEQLAQHNIMLISSRDAVGKDNEADSLGYVSPVTVTDMGISVGKKEIYQADSYRLLSSNPLNDHNKLVYFYANEWTTSAISYMLDHVSEGFLALYEDKPVAVSHYISEQELGERLELKDEDHWFVKGNESAKVLYQSLSEAQGDQFLEIWGLLSQQINRMLPQSSHMNTLQVSDGRNVGVASAEKRSSDILRIKYYSLKELEPYRSGGRDWIEKISITMLTKTQLQTVENKLGDDFWHNNYEVAFSDMSKELSEEGKNFLENPQLLGRESANSLIYYLISLVDQSSQLDSLLKDIASASKVDDEQLRALFAKYVPSVEVKTILDLYEQNTK